MTEYETQSLALLGKILTALESRPAQASGAQTGGYKPSTGPLTGWRAYVLTFSKNKGTPLGKLNEKQLQWYMENCKGEGYKGAPPRQSDLDLKAALDAAKAELYPANQAPASDRSPDESFDVPF